MAKGAGATGAKAKVKFKGAGSFLGHRTSAYLTAPAGRACGPMPGWGPSFAMRYPTLT